MSDETKSARGRVGRDDFGGLGLRGAAQDTKVDPASIPPVARVIRGKVVDAAGKPVAGITLSTHWIVQEDQPPRAVEGVTKTDDQGRFQLELTFYYGRSESLCATSTTNLVFLRRNSGRDLRNIKLANP